MFKIMDNVNIKEIDVKGIIISIHQQMHSTEYEVKYFMNGEPNRIYYYDFELEKI